MKQSLIQMSITPLNKFSREAEKVGSKIFAVDGRWSWNFVKEKSTKGSVKNEI